MWDGSSRDLHALNVRSCKRMHIASNIDSKRRWVFSFDYIFHTCLESGVKQVFGGSWEQRIRVDECKSVFDGPGDVVFQFCLIAHTTYTTLHKFSTFSCSVNKRKDGDSRNQLFGKSLIKQIIVLIKINVIVSCG